jgi:hypothetical protein
MGMKDCSSRYAMADVEESHLALHKVAIDHFKMECNMIILGKITVKNWVVG